MNQKQNIMYYLYYTNYIMSNIEIIFFHFIFNILQTYWANAKCNNFVYNFAFVSSKYLNVFRIEKIVFEYD